MGLVPAGGAIDVFLQWSDAQGSSGNDYNFGIWDVANGGYLVRSVDLQTGTQNPYEARRWTNNTGAPLQVAIVVDDNGSPASRELELFVVPRSFVLSNLIDNDRTTGDSVFGHAADVDAISVGAIDADDPGNDTIEFFSNQGPSTIYTNFVSQTSTTRNTLDGAGIDGVQTRIGQLGVFNNPFFGTSAAAPHIAGVAALLLELNPDLTSDQVSTVLNERADDLGALGYDDVSGFGRFDAVAAADSVRATVGDYTRDNAVDGFDFLSWQRGFGDAVAPVGSGADGDLSGSVGAGDLAVWQDHYGETVPGAAVAATTEGKIDEDSLVSLAQAMAGKEQAVDDVAEFVSEDPTYNPIVPRTVDRALVEFTASRDATTFTTTKRDAKATDDAIESLEDSLLVAFV